MLSTQTAAAHRGATATLFLDGTEVGRLTIRGGNTAWGFGEFCPNCKFEPFAPLFGAWSLLMHAEDDSDKLSRDAAVELTVLESRLDSLHIGLFFPDEQQWVPVVQVTIDGPLLEWREF